jgi:hypothetical protein
MHTSSSSTFCFGIHGGFLCVSRIDPVSKYLKALQGNTSKEFASDTEEGNAAVVVALEH